MQRMSEVERGGAEAEFKGNMAAKSRPASADHKIIHASQRHPKPAWDFWRLLVTRRGQGKARWSFDFFGGSDRQNSMFDAAISRTAPANQRRLPDNVQAWRSRLVAEPAGVEQGPARLSATCRVQESTSSSDATLSQPQQDEQSNLLPLTSHYLFTSYRI